MKSVPLTFDAYASWKSILRHHPFFQAGGMFGYDFRTMNACYPDDCRVLKAVIVAAQAGQNVQGCPVLASRPESEMEQRGGK